MYFRSLQIFLISFATFFIPSSAFKHRTRTTFLCRRKAQFTRQKSIPTRDKILFNPLNSTDTESVQSVTIMRNQVFGVDVDDIPLLAAYFVQGSLGLSRLATTYFLKDTLNLSPSEIATITGLFSIPWIIKPLYGFLSDGLPIFGYRRKSYLILSGIFGFLSWLALGTIVDSPGAALFANLIGSASIAVSDVVVDSIVVEKSREQQELAMSGGHSTTSNINNPGMVGGNELDKVEHQQQHLVSSVTHNNTLLSTNEPTAPTTTFATRAGDLQSLCWGASSVGAIISSYWSGSLLEVLTVRQVFIITAFLPLIISFTSIFLPEKRMKQIDNTLSKSTSSSSFTMYTTSNASNNNNNIQELQTKIISQLKELKTTFSNPQIYLPVLFIFLWQATPSPGSAMFYYSTNNLGFQPEFMGRVRLASSISSLFGVILFRWKLKFYSSKNVIYWATLASSLLGLTPILLILHINRSLGIPDAVFSLVDTSVLTILGQIAFMPTLVLASSLCPPGIEGTLFSTLMSIYNAAGVLSTELGAGLTSALNVKEDNYDNLALLIAICSLSNLVTLPFINLLDYQKKNLDSVGNEKSK